MSKCAEHQKEIHDCMNSQAEAERQSGLAVKWHQATDNAMEKIAALQAENAELRAIAKLAIEWSEYETEYDGRMLTVCQACGNDISDDGHKSNCQLETYKQALTRPPESRR